MHTTLNLWVAHEFLRLASPSECRLEAIAIRLEVIASRVEAITSFRHTWRVNLSAGSITSPCTTSCGGLMDPAAGPNTSPPRVPWMWNSHFDGSKRHALIAHASSSPTLAVPHLHSESLAWRWKRTTCSVYLRIAYNHTLGAMPSKPPVGPGPPDGLWR